LGTLGVFKALIGGKLSLGFAELEVFEPHVVFFEGELDSVFGGR
jgi:hypothetical protein